MDTRTVWFVVETKDEQDRLSTEYPGHILLYDQTFVLDTHSGKAVENTKKMHEFSSVDTEVSSVYPQKMGRSSGKLTLQLQPMLHWSN